MLQGRQGAEAGPSTAVASQQIVAVGEMEDLARQALAATGGKSTLKATKWLLERRAEVVQKQIDVDTMVAHENNEEIAPSSPSLWGNNEHNVTDPYAAGARSDAIQGLYQSKNEISANVSSYATHRPLKSTNSLPSSKVSGAFERHASIASCGVAPFDMVEPTHQLSILPNSMEQKEPTMAFRSPRSPEAEEMAMASIPLPAPARQVAAVGSASPLQGGGSHKRKWMDDVVDIAVPMFSTSPTSISPTGAIQHTQIPGKSLADRMRPNSISDILGQDHLHTVLHSLGDGESLPCIILGGPHGTGKTSIARLIARSASCRFVALSTLLKSADFDIQEIIDEAKQARKFGQRTVFFVESLIGFSKSYQECLIQAIEAGYAVFIGATADNPSTDLIANLLMRCRILTLRKLRHEHLCTIMKRAISDLERGIHISLGDVPVVEVLAIEDEVIPFIATSADGDARVALNALEAAVCIAHGKLRQKRMSSLAQAEEIPLKEREKPIGIAKRDNPYAKLEHLKGQIPFVQGEYSAAEAELAERRSTKNSPRLDIENALIINMVDAKEAFLRPEMLVKDRKAVEESDSADLISALLQAMRGGDSNAAVYWLVRVFEKVEQDPLRITPVLTKFASEEVGMADPQALVQAIACHQACQVIGGGKDCTSCLTQCVVYLSMARKSDALLRAFQSARKVIREAQNEPVPMHLRSSSSSSREHSCYLPPSLRNFIFLRLPDAQ